MAASIVLVMGIKPVNKLINKINYFINIAGSVLFPTMFVLADRYVRKKWYLAASLVGGKLPQRFFENVDPPNYLNQGNTVQVH